jgi:hypothetical protein
MQQNQMSLSRRYHLGRSLHPESVTEAWYAAKCPPDFSPGRYGIGPWVVLRWRFACWLRGATP